MAYASHPLRAVLFGASLAALTGAALLTPEISAALDGKCATCDIKSKSPIAGKTDEFDFEMACAFDITNDEKPFHVIAKDEDEARRKSQTEAPGDCW